MCMVSRTWQQLPLIPGLCPCWEGIAPSHVLALPQSPFIVAPPQVPKIAEFFHGPNVGILNYHSVTLSRTVLLVFLCTFLFLPYPPFLSSFLLSFLFYFSIVLLISFMYLFCLLIESLGPSDTKGIFDISLSLQPVI